MMDADYVSSKGVSAGEGVTTDRARPLTACIGGDMVLVKVANYRCL